MSDAPIADGTLLERAELNQMSPTTLQATRPHLQRVILPAPVSVPVPPIQIGPLDV